MYRYGRPAGAATASDWQWSVEALGSADPAIDAEILQLYVELLRRVGVTEWELKLNSIEDELPAAYVERLNTWLDALGGPRRGRAPQTRLSRSRSST